MGRGWPLYAVALLAACVDDAGSPSADALQVLQPADTPVSEVRWTAPDGQSSRIVAEDPEGRQTATDWVVGTGAAEAQLFLGLAAATDYHAWIELEDGSTYGDTDFTTDPLPTEFAEWSTEGKAGWRGWMLTNVLGSISRPVLLDDEGRVTWYGPEAPAGSTVIRAAFRAEGDGVWVLVEEEDRTLNELRAYAWTGEVLATYPAAEWTHDFVPLESGELAWLKYQCERMEGLGPVCGEIVSVGVPGTEARPRRVWSTFDDFDPTVDGVVNSGGDWSHANALDVDEAAGVAHVSLRGLNAIVEVGLGGEGLLRQIGGPHPTYAAVDEAAVLDGQHQFQFYGGDRVIVHDNRFTGTASRVVTLRLDDEAGTVEALEELTLDPTVWVYALGDVDRSVQGTLVTWSTAGILSDHDASGQERWRATGSLGTAFGYTTRTTELPGMAPVEPIDQ